MSTYKQFPDKSVVLYIEELAQRHGFKINERIYIQESQMIDENSEWRWVLTLPSSSVNLDIVFLYPSYISLISFDNGIKNFDFETYLKQHLKANNDLKVIKDISKNRRWPQDWSKQLDILEQHLATDLTPVVRGEEWPNVVFRWEDYATPEALDRIHSDTLAKIEKNKKSGANPWVYFVNFVTGKKPPK